MSRSDGKNCKKPGELSPVFAFMSYIILERVKDEPGLLPEDVYSVFTFAPVHTLHLGISKLLKNCFVSYFPSRALCTRERGSATAARTFLHLKGGRLCVCLSLLAYMEKEFPVTALRVDFSKVEQSSQFNWLFTIVGVHGMLEGKDCQCLDMVFSFN